MYSISDPAAIKIIYGVTNPMPKSGWYRSWGDPRVPNHNLFAATDPKVHSQMRRKVANLYSMTAIKSYEPYVDSCIRALTTKFDRVAKSGEVLDLQRWMQCYAFDVIGELTVSRCAKVPVSMLIKHSSLACGLASSMMAKILTA